MNGLGLSAPPVYSFNDITGTLSTDRLSGNISVDKLNGIVPINKGGTGASTIIDGANNVRAYGYYKFTGDLQINSSKSRTVTLSLTTHGRPVFMCIAGDWNGTVSSSWIRANLYIDGSTVATSICHEAYAASANRPFVRTFMSVPSAGTHTFEAKIIIGAGDGTIGEEGDIQSPCFIVFEI